MHPKTIQTMGRKQNENNTAMVHVYEREQIKGVRFYLVYTLNGKQVKEKLELPTVKRNDRQAYRETRAKADAMAFERMSQIRDGKLGMTTRHSKLLLYDWMQYCADEDIRRKEESDRSRHTWARMIRQTAEILEEYAPNTMVAKVDKAFVKGFIDWLQHGYTIKRYSTRGGVQNEGAHLSPKTAQKKYLCFHACMEKAVRDDVIIRNPCAMIDPTDKIKAPQTERRALTEEELRALVATPTDSGVRNVYLFMCMCGLRISDVKALRWGNVVEKDGHIWLNVRQQKTKEYNYLPLSDEAAALMPQRNGQPDDAIVFANIPSEPAMNRALKTWAAHAGISNPQEITLHTGRHTHGTLLLTKGAGIYDVAKMLGHTNVKTTQIYAKMVDSRKAEVANLMNGILNPIK